MNILNECLNCGESKKCKKSKYGYICEICYKKKYKTPEEMCGVCGNINNVFKRIGSLVICRRCYIKNYNAPKYKCFCCLEEKAIHKNTEDGPICKRCYKSKYKPPEKMCCICLKLKVISKNTKNGPLCQNCYCKWRLENDKTFATKTRLRKKISKTLRLKKRRIGIEINYSSIIDYLGDCPGDMSNYHIDHIFPLCAFDFNNPIHIVAAFAPENHQWMKKSENMSKKGKYDINKFTEYLLKF